MYTTNSDREALNKFKEVLRKKGKDPEQYVITPTFLRVEAKLVASQSVYKFDVKNTTAGSAIEKKLDINDTFFVTHLGIQNYPWLTTGPRFNFPESYINKTRYVAAAGFVPDHLNLIYQGKLSIKVGTKTVIEEMDTNRFLSIPQTQQSGATNYSQKDGDSALVELTPNVILSGKAANDITLELPSDGNPQWANTNANTDNYVVFLAKGFLVKSFNL